MKLEYHQKTFRVPHLLRCGLFFGFRIPKKEYAIIEPQHKCCGFLFAIKKLEKIRKGKYRKYKSVYDLKKSIEKRRA